ncbi:MAG: N-acetyltransferase [Spirochaetales bacterium]|nr:N-acetyltransferase [Spirochaetales bacterium]
MDTPDTITLRPATVEDVKDIVRLTSSMARQGLMLPRSKYKIITMLSDFLVAVTAEGTIAGCGAFSVLWTDLGEICALAVDPAYQKKGIGARLVRALIEEGKKKRVPEIIALTYQVDFFTRLGFTVTDKDDFPRKVWRECLECPKLEECDETAVRLYVHR